MRVFLLQSCASSSLRYFSHSLNKCAVVVKETKNIIIIIIIIRAEVGLK